MLFTILAWIYISIISWIFGYKFCQLLGKATESVNAMHFGVVCIIGLSFTTTLASYLSLLTGLNNSYLHLVMLAASVLLTFTIPKQAFKKLKTFWPSNNLTLLILLITCILLLLVMGTWYIKHPDTLEYHSAIIESIKKKGLEIGLAQMNIRYGLQSNWFVSCALFSFDFFPFRNLTFINTCVLFWLSCFVIHKIQANSFLKTKENDHYSSLLWLLFLGVAFWDYTQIRLTATSASPDYPTVLYILLSTFLFKTETLSRNNILLILFLIAFAFSLKLSSFPLAILLTYLSFVLVKKQPSALISATTLLILTISPFLLRNYFTSGHLLYPSSALSIEKPSWQIDTKTIHYIQEYIKAYARTASSEDSSVVKQVVSAPGTEWIPIWWKLKSIAQKSMILFTIVASLSSLFAMFKYGASFTSRQVILLLTSLTGLICWFILAPDPRFGVAFFVLLNYLLLKIVIPPYWESRVKRKTLYVLIYMITIVLVLYLSYRLFYFFDLANLVFPYSI